MVVWHICLFSPLVIRKIPIFASYFFRWVGSTTNPRCSVGLVYSPTFTPLNYPVFCRFIDHIIECLGTTVDGRNPAPVEVGSWNPIIYKVLAPFQVVVWDFWTINSSTFLEKSPSSVQEISEKNATSRDDVAIAAWPIVASMGLVYLPTWKTYFTIA